MFSFTIKLYFVVITITMIQCENPEEELPTVIEESSETSISSYIGFSIKVIIPETGETLTKPCKICSRGKEPSIPCGSTVQSRNFTLRQYRCRRCPSGTFSTRRSKSQCTRCSNCRIGQVTLKKCTRRHDTICQSCPKGFYFERYHFSCLRCSRCCGDSQDVKVDSCITQGSQHHCSYQSYIRCHGESRNASNRMDLERRIIKTIPTVALTMRVSTTLSNDFIRTNNRTFSSNETDEREQNLLFDEESNSKHLVLIFSLIALLGLNIVIICFIFRTKKGKYRNTCSVPLLRITKQKCQSMFKSDQLDEIDESATQGLNFLPNRSDQSDQSDEFGDWATPDIKSGKYNFKCGVWVSYDTSSSTDGGKNLVIEVLEDDILYLNLKNSVATNQIILSPKFKFFSQGTQFEKPVQVCLPHSALIKPSSKTWAMDVLFTDAREGKEAKWSKVKSEINVDWNEVTFKTNTLLTYVVVGTPLENARKRMQLSVFAMRRMQSDRFKLVLYLFDDDESSLQRIFKDNHSKGWTMIGSLYAVFVDCYHQVNMNVQVEGLQEPWSLVHLNRKVTSEMVKDSYTNIPQYHGVFRRSKRNATHFSCSLRVDIGGKETIVPVTTFVPEELMCVFVEVHEDPSIYDSKTLVRDIPYDVNYEFCRKLDVPVKGRGQWRELGYSLGIPENEVEECSREYVSLDGSPSMRLMEIICVKRPEVTVGEFARCLKKLDRCDALSALKSLKKYDC